MVGVSDSVTGMKRQVGWFVMLGIGVLLFILLLASMRSNVFAKKFYLFVEPPSASSFYEGQAVKFQGFAIGRIDQIELQHEGQVRVSVKLLERYRHMLHAGAVVRLVKEGLLGEQIVEITAGNVEKTVLQSGETLGYETEASLDQLLTELKPAVGNANILLKEMAELSTWMNNPDSDLRVGLASLRNIAESVQGDSIKLAVQTFTETLSELQSVASDMGEQKIALKLADSLQKASDILSNIEPLSESIGQKGPDTMRHINELLAHVDELSGTLNMVAEDLSEMTPELPSLASESRATLKEMKALLKSLQGSWLLGSGDPAKEPVEQLEAAPAMVGQ
ncbi:MAG: MlaD family protein [Mariprofundaceae bacterium]